MEWLVFYDDSNHKGKPFYNGLIIEAAAVDLPRLFLEEKFALAARIAAQKRRKRRSDERRSPL